MSRIPAPEDPPVHEPPTTKEGWSAFVNQPPSKVTLLSAERWAALEPDHRDAYHEQRLSHHAGLIVVATPTVDQIVNTGRRLVLLNRGQDTARRGLVVTGDSGTGKSTAIKQLGKHHELLARRRRTALGPFMPVVYVTVPPAATAKVLATRGGAESSDQLKYLAERIPATFVYAGIDVEHAGLFSGVRGRQIAGRFASIATTSFAYGTRAQREQWVALVGALEHALRLHQHRAGTLLRLAGYLHQRTGGMIGSLSHLIRDAAIEAIFDGSERITKAALDRVVLDHAAEHPHVSASPPTARPKRTSGRTASSGAA